MAGATYLTKRCFGKLLQRLPFAHCILVALFVSFHDSAAPAGVMSVLLLLLLPAACR
jgi:hypothetical protein